MDLTRPNRMSEHLKALSDVNRIRILEILVHGEFCVTDLVRRLEIDQPKVSHHLAILRSAGVIRSRRDGRHINYSLRPAVHRRQGTDDAPVDVFDLGSVAVSFRFGGDAAGGARPAVVSRPARLREAGESLELGASGG